MVKNYNTIQKSSDLTDEDLRLINTYTLKPLKKEDVFVFSVILCDNDIDRDLERFSLSSLHSLKELFVGKTGILNHSMQSEDQSTRTFRTELLTDKNRKTLDGREYTYLKAWCYTIRSPKNEGLIRDIEGGIKKEVSISCSAETKLCSICGEPVCSHIKGKTYDGEYCYKVIDSVTDAYEWSFVAVPAQRNAGVTKSFKNKKESFQMKNILKSLEENKEVTLTGDESSKLFDYIKELKSESHDGKVYREKLTTDAKKSLALAIPEMDEGLVDSILKGLSVENLNSLCQVIEKKMAKIIPPMPQLWHGEKENKNNQNNEFKF